MENVDKINHRSKITHDLKNRACSVKIHVYDQINFQHKTQLLKQNILFTYYQLTAVTIYPFVKTNRTIEEKITTNKATTKTDTHSIQCHGNVDFLIIP
jgi:hypothetical protein